MRTLFLVEKKCTHENALNHEIGFKRPIEKHQSLT